MSECGAGESACADAEKAGAGRRKAPITRFAQSLKKAVCRAGFEQQLSSLAAGQAAINSMKVLAAKVPLIEPASARPPEETETPLYSALLLIYML